MAIWNMLARLTMDSSAFDRESAKAKRSMYDLQKQATLSSLSIQRMASTGLALAGLGGGIYGLARAYTSLTQASFAQERATRRIYTLMGNVAGTTKDNIAATIKYTQALQKVTTIGDDVGQVGASQLATFQLQASTIDQLLPSLYDLAVGVNGVKVSQEQMITVSNLMGKAMTGQVGALTRYGVTLTDAQAKTIQYGNEQQRAATIVNILKANFGGLAEQMGKTSEGRLAQLANRWSDLKESLGAPIANAAIWSLEQFDQATTDMAESLRNATTAYEQLKELMTSGPISSAVSGTLRTSGMGPSLMTGIDAGTATRPRVPLQSLGLPSKKEFIDTYSSEYVRVYSMMDDKARSIEQKLLNTTGLRYARDLYGLTGSEEDKLVAASREVWAKSRTAYPQKGGQLRIMPPEMDLADKEVIEATARMYKEIGRQSEAATQAQIAQFQLQRNAYIELGVDKVQADAWYTSRVKSLWDEQDQADAKRRDEISKATVSMYRDIDSQSQASTTAQMAELMKQRRAYEDLGVANATIAEWFGAKVKDLYTKETADAEAAALDIARAVANMYDQIDSRTIESFAAKERLLEAEYNQYAKTIKDKDALDRWRRDRQLTLQIERAEGTGTWYEGAAAGVSRMNKELLKTGQIMSNVAIQARDGIVGAINEAVFRSGDLARSSQDLGLSLLEYGLTERYFKPATTAGMDYFLPDLSSAKGNAFETGGLKRFAKGGVVTQPTLFSYADGIGQMGEAGPEAVAPLGRDSQGRLGVHVVDRSVRQNAAPVAPQVTVNVNNHTAAQLEAPDVDVQFDGRRMLVGLVLKDKRNRGPISRALGRRG